MSIFRYSVKLDSRDPIYGRTKLLKEFGEDKAEAVRWATSHGQEYGKDRTMVYVEEAEFASERNLEKNMPMYRRHIWSAAFHGYPKEEA